MIEQNAATIKEILGSVYFTDIKDVTEREDREEATEYLLSIDEEKFKDKINTLLKKSKIRMLEGIGSKGPDIIIEELFDLEESQKLVKLDFGAKIEIIADKITLSDCYYYYSHFKHHRSRVYFYDIPLQEGQLRTDLEKEFSSALNEMKNPKMKNYLEKAFSSTYGMPLLGSNIMMDEPIPHIVKLEDDRHVYFEFWKASDEKPFIDFIQGDFITVRTPIIISCRLCLASSFLELWSSPTRKEDIERTASLVHNIFDLKLGEKKYINQSHIKILEEISISETHQSREGSGRSSNATLTAPDPGGDTRTDPVLSDLSKRRYREANFSLSIPTMRDEIIAGISAEDDYLRIYKQNISPKDRTAVFEYLLRTLGLI